MKTLLFLLLSILLAANLTVARATSNTPESPSDLKSVKLPVETREHGSSVRDVLEIAYFISGIIVAAAAVVALRQLQLARLQISIASDALVVAKEDIKIRSRREAIALAADHCEDFATTVIPKIHKGIDEFHQKDMKTERWKLLNKAFDDTSLKEPKEALVWFQQGLSKELGSTACNLLNQLEAFAIYFATGAADENVAFPVVGPLFCTYVEMFAPWLIFMRTKKDAAYTSGKYANTVRLYEIWVDRIRREEILAQTKNAEKELGALKDQRIDPIGCER